MNIHRFYAGLFRVFRRGRMRQFEATFSPSPAMRVLDLGGGAFNWSLVETLPEVTILNLDPAQARNQGFPSIVGDACHAPVPDGSFDVVFSNSVIEHVGGLERQKAFADECRRCARSYFVQTPNRWFPIDPHTFAPFLHWMPKKIYNAFLRFTPRFLITPGDEEAMLDFRAMRLLGVRDMKELFPEGTVVKERFCGLTRSIIVYRK